MHNIFFEKKEIKEIDFFNGNYDTQSLMANTMKYVCTYIIMIYLYFLKITDDNLKNDESKANMKQA